MVQVSGGTLARTSSVAPSTKSKSNFSGNKGSTQCSEQGLPPCSFFVCGKLCAVTTNAIERSFELAAARCEDLTPLVYRRLFDRHPEAKAMFRTEGSAPVMGSMLALTIDAILDLAGDRSGPFRLIECEVSSHDAYGTPRQLFGEFFGIIADSLRELLGEDWSPEIDSAWHRLLIEIESMIAHVES